MVVSEVDIPCLALSVVDIVEAEIVTVELSAVEAEVEAELFQMSPFSSTTSDDAGNFQSEAALPNESPMLLLFALLQDLPPKPLFTVLSP